jgi:hypothetical protein
MSRPLDLEEIRKWLGYADPDDAHRICEGHVRALIAEVERLRDGLQQIAAPPMPGEGARYECGNLHGAEDLAKSLLNRP